MTTTPAERDRLTAATSGLGPLRTWGPHASERAWGKVREDYSEHSTGRRRVLGDESLFKTHPAWHDLVPFHEYFPGDSGKGFGAAHQTGGAGLVATLTMRSRS